MRTDGTVGKPCRRRPSACGDSECGLGRRRRSGSKQSARPRRDVLCAAVKTRGPNGPGLSCPPAAHAALEPNLHHAANLELHGTLRRHLDALEGLGVLSDPSGTLFRLEDAEIPEL